VFQQGAVSGPGGKRWQRVTQEMIWRTSSALQQSDTVLEDKLITTRRRGQQHRGAPRRGCAAIRCYCVGSRGGTGAALSRTVEGTSEAGGHVPAGAEEYIRQLRKTRRRPTRRNVFRAYSDGQQG
jgi:hypothetical protein